jgi:hypothetical protein
LRDAEPMEAYVAQHVNTCAACSRELERLRGVQRALQSLPTVQAPPYTPASLALKPNSHRFRNLSIAAAAAGVGVIALLIGLARHPEREYRHLANETLVATAIPTAAKKAQVDPTIAALVDRSQKLESQLRQLPSRPTVERAGTSTTIDSLESSIQWVDYKLSIANDAGLTEQQAAQLWQNRIHLMDSLVKVRYAEAQRFAVL